MKDDVRELLDLLTAEVLPDARLDELVMQVLRTYENVNGEQDWLVGAREEGAVSMLWLTYGLLFALVREGLIATFGRWRDVHDQLSAQFETPLPQVPREVNYLHEYLVWLEQQYRLRGYVLLEYPEHVTDDMHVLSVARKRLPRVMELAGRFRIDIKSAFDNPMESTRRGQ